MKLYDDVQDVISKNKLDGYIDEYLFFDVYVDKLERNESIKKAFSEYVKEHDHMYDEWDFVLEEVKEWEKEIDDFYNSCDDKSPRPNVLINALKKNNIKAYKLNYTGPREGSPIEIVDKNKEIAYTDDGVMGWIRCYESGDDRIIIKWICYD